MSEEENERKANTATCSLNSHARELCKKAKETLEKANKLLSRPGKFQDPAKQCDGEEKS
jgi:hypothetical protein